MEAVLELDVSRFQADMAVATPLSSAVGRCNGSKVDMSSMVLAAEARLETRVLRLEARICRLETRYSMFGHPQHATFQPRDLRLT